MRYIDLKQVKIDKNNHEVNKPTDKLIYTILIGISIFIEFLSDIFSVFAFIKLIFKHVNTKNCLKHLLCQSSIIINQADWIIQSFKFHKSLLFEEIFIFLVCAAIKIYSILIRIRIKLFRIYKIYKRNSNLLIWELLKQKINL